MLDSRETRGMLFGVVGVAIFSLTLPMSRLAVAELDPTFIALGRAVIAAILGAIMLWWIKAPIPTRVQWHRLALVAFGCVFGFPLFSTMAMHEVPAAHGAIVLGVLPLATALAGALRFGERPSIGFWISAVLGSALVVTFALTQGGGSFSQADGYLVAAVVCAAIGYAEGGRLAQSLGGLVVIAWALVLGLPILLPVTIWVVVVHGAHASTQAWWAFGYVSVFSMFIGFYFWYKGLAMGGIARVGQVQLMQPFLSLFAASLLLGETVVARQIVFALSIVAVVAIGRRMPIRQQSRPVVTPQLDSIAGRG